MTHLYKCRSPYSARALGIDELDYDHMELHFHGGSGDDSLQKIQLQ